MTLEYHHLAATTYYYNCFRWESLWMLLVIKSVIRRRILVECQCTSAQETYSFQREKKCNFMVPQICKHSIIHTIKNNITSNGIKRHHMSWKRIQHYFWSVPPPKKNDSTNEETSDKPKWWGILQNNWSVHFKYITV